MTTRTMQDLFVHSLSDIYNAEKQWAKALPKLARAASDPKLAGILQGHLDETMGQIERIDQVVDKCQLKLRRMKCAAMEGLIEEADELIGEVVKGPVLDAALIEAVQKIEHYEIAAYGTLLAFAKSLDLKDAMSLLKDSLSEEKNADKQLTTLAESSANQHAAMQRSTVSV